MKNNKKSSKSLWIVFAVICVIAIGVGSFFAVKHFEAKKQEKATKTTTETTTEAKVQSKYKEVSITGAKETVQLGQPSKGETIVDMEVKDYGHMKFKFFLDDAPKAVKNFVTLASNGYYNGLKFHRVISDFMIQSGDPTGTGTGGESIWGTTFENEISKTLLPLRGALCMANSGGDSSNGSQFFIVQNAIVTDDIISQSGMSFTKEQIQTMKDQGGYPSLYGGYTIFGQMYDGYDVLDEIASVKTISDDQSEDRPQKDVIIKKITVSNFK
ncbi:MAG: peptidylprolyl isomerase [Anaerostipes sp.]|jgi:peptidyl-prolyl cis-trans isomerase A (cyclophilin A)